MQQAEACQDIVRDGQPRGKHNNLIADCQDPKTKRDWVYVNDCGDNSEAWNGPDLNSTQSLAEKLQRAVFKAGGVPRCHGTDSLSAA